MPQTQALPEAGKRYPVPIAIVFPGPSDLKTGVSEKGSNASVGELVTVLSVNRFVGHELEIKLRVPDAYILLLSALEVHLDP